jgi:hypothetical protein
VVRTGAILLLNVGSRHARVLTTSRPAEENGIYTPLYGEADACGLNKIKWRYQWAMRHCFPSFPMTTERLDAFKADVLPRGQSRRPSESTLPNVFTVGRGRVCAEQGVQPGRNHWDDCRDSPFNGPEAGHWCPSVKRSPVQQDLDLSALIDQRLPERRKKCCGA